MNLKEKWATRLILASFCSVVLAFRTRRDDGWLFLIPAVIMLGYLAIFLQWGVSGYLLIASAPGVALFIVLMIHYLAGVFGSEKFRSVSFALLAVAAVGVTIYKSQKELSRFGDVRQVVYSDAAKRIASEHGVLLMPCWEGSDAMRYYFKRFAGLDIDVVYTQDSKDAVKKYPALPVYWLGGDRNFCGVSDEGKQIVFPPLKPGGFRLLRDLRTI